MCVSLAPARFSNTTLYAAEVQVGKDLLHVLGYQNRAQNLGAPPGVTDDDWDWGPRSGSAPSRSVGVPGNAMILPFPALPGSMDQANVVSTADCPRILKDMAEALRPRRRGMRSATLGADSRSIPKGIQIFEHDIYTVVLATDARLIAGVLDFVPEDKRPALNRAVFEAYAEWYPGWAVALCCFNNSQAAEAKPMLWWYKPSIPERLFMPALDSHTGDVPDLHAKVEVDHTVAVGSFALEDGSSVSYRDDIPGAVRPFLVDRVVGEQFSGSEPNGDFVCRTEDVRQGKFEPKRLSPPGATI